MKHIGKIMAVGLVLSLIGFIGITAAGAAGPKLVAVTAKVDLAKESKVKFKGTGFKPGQMVNLLFTGHDGVQTDIGYALKPAPKAGDNGEWETTWSAKDMIGKKLIKAGDYTFTATDSEYNTIDAATVNFFGKFVKKKKKK